MFSASGASKRRTTVSPRPGSLRASSELMFCESQRMRTDVRIGAGRNVEATSTNRRCNGTDRSGILRERSRAGGAVHSQLPPGTRARDWRRPRGQIFTSSGAGEQRFAAHERLARRRADLDRDDLARRGEAVEVDDLVMCGPAAQLRRVVARMALDEHVERAADEA